MPRRLGDLEMPAHLVEFLARGELLVPFSELADDLIRRVPPALLGCPRPVILPALTGNTVAQHLDHYEGLSSAPPRSGSPRPDHHRMRRRVRSSTTSSRTENLSAVTTDVI